MTNDSISGALSTIKGILGYDSKLQEEMGTNTIHAMDCVKLVLCMQRVITTEIKLHRAMEATVWREITHFGPLKSLSCPGVTLVTLTRQIF
jgi:hypothetical protein